MLTHQVLKEKKFSKFDKIFRNDALLFLDFEYKIVFSISHLVLKLFTINFFSKKNCFSRCSFIYKYFFTPFCMYKAIHKTNPEPLEFLKYLNPLFFYDFVKFSRFKKIFQKNGRFFFVPTWLLRSSASI